ncbi:M23 family metallopeptidase [Stenoxybacter acetivorans]|uniref:M23 family metallopeptidase n=1 Tax=Stenoxybacter acetivorans TaxID=422441 RepID=UPI0012EC0325|nr:M23 family metallopeptidase [Stenoxybacter acetivorans]
MKLTILSAAKKYLNRVIVQYRQFVENRQIKALLRRAAYPNRNTPAAKWFVAIRRIPLRWAAVLIGLPISSVMAAYAISGQDPARTKHAAQIVVEALPPITITEPPQSNSYWHDEVVRHGDNLTLVLKRLGVSEREIQNVLKESPINKKMLQLQPSQTFGVRVDKDGSLTDIQFFNDDDNGEKHLIALKKIADTWTADVGELDADTLPTFKAVVVKTSARGALAQANVPVEIRESLSEMFKDKLDLNTLKSGDTIRLLYNSLYYRGQELATDDILGVEISQGNQLYQAYYFEEDNDGNGQYYDAKGSPLRKGFDIQPVSNARISSSFGTRYHPILHTIRMHTGIDYAAPSGTPIHAPSDGVIAEMGAKGGYGYAVVIRHNTNMETLYGHMSAFGDFSPGSRVKAGDIIGYVGSTGRSTGPHLHYEVRINGQPVNPTSVALPSKKLSKTELAEFKQEQGRLNGILASVRNLHTTIAQLD